jgi:DNA repair exonuclease SbcCD ATPase subunit
MPRYFLTKIRVEGFRGINNEADPLELRFRPDAVNSVFAVNGIGKSSLFEALSYAIRGYIPKLEALQSQERPGDYYCNRFHSRNHATIDLEFEPDDGSGTAISVHVERNSAGQRMLSSPSGHPTPEAFLASLNEDFTLLDYRAFSRFIEDSPLERGRSFSALLGLSAYSDMRQSLQAASDTRTLNTDFDINVISSSITAAQQVSQQALASIRTNYERVTGKALEDVDRLDEYLDEVATGFGRIELIKPYFHGKSLAEVDFEATKKAIREAEGGEKRKELERVVETITKLEALGTIDPPMVTAEQQVLFTFIDERDGQLSATRGDLFKRLYEAASNLIGKGEWVDESTCPLCLGQVETSIKAHIDGQLEQYRSVADKIAHIKESWRSAQWVRRLDLLEKAETLGVDDVDRITARLSQRAASGDLTREEFAAAVTRLAALEELVAGKLKEVNVRKEQLEKQLPQSLVQLTEQVEYGRQFKDSTLLYRNKQKEETSYRARLDSRERWRTFILRATTVFSLAEAALSKAKIGAIDSEYKSMFKQIMNVGDVVPDLQRADDREDLHVQLSDFHGQHRVSARALLSESYRNALAISVFLAAALKHAGVPRFVILDDVTSSFDAGHQYFLMELIRQNLQHPRHAQGLQFIILSHDGLLEKYFDRYDGTGSWRHHKLQGAPPMGAILSQTQDANRLKTTIETLLTAGQVTQAEPLIRQYLEYKLQQIIRRVDVPVPIDFAMKDHSRMVSNCLDAITSAVSLHKLAGTLVLDAQQVRDLDTVHVSAIVGNWVSHYDTGSTSSLSAPMLKGVIKSIDNLTECFRFDDNSSGAVTRRWYKSLSRRT